ncbi:virion protein [Thalassotalea eurytherma]|uniref:Virion protein n=1 Tax=Thalassotalea eurytherma TaxID=1144278 RepID=A0ABQ6GY69_9GAMM|nr:virion protein [Thalassotalea eurytherma]GLX80891.1 hypothetical protein theurythT_03430 [Thalassotalea eurytherma]
MTKTGLAVLALLLWGITMNEKQTRGIRNNNPLNIRKGENWLGLVGDDGAFAQFETPEHGIRAGARILRTYRNKYGLNSVHAIINRFAPPSENNTTSYIDHAAAFVGVGRYEPLLESDYPRLIEVMIKHENGVQPYTEKQILNGFNWGFYDEQIS